MKSRYILFIAFIFLSSCKSIKQAEIKYKEIQFQETEDIEFSILTNDFLLNAPRDIDFYKNVVVVLGQYDGKLLHFFDANTGDYISGTLQFGRGNKEVMIVKEFSLNQSTGDVMVFDIQQRKVCCVNVDSILQNGDAISEIDHLNLNNGADAVYFKDKRNYIGYKTIGYLSKDKKTRFYNFKDGEINHRYDDYPLLDSMDFYYVYQYQKVAFSRSQDKMAVGTMFGAILETFDVSDGIVNKSTSYYIKPEYSGDGSPISNEKTIYGFIDMYGTDNFIYSSYSGCSAVPENYKNIAIFDWNAKPLRLLKSKYNILSLSVDISDKKIYAILYDDLSKEFNIGWTEI